MKELDVVIVGGGAAGLGAALVLSRARRRVAVVDAGHPRNAPAEHMHGFLSRDGESPLAFLATGRAEVAGYGAELIEDTVAGIAPGFQVRLAGGRTLSARRVLVTTGLRDELPPIPGVRPRWGRDVLHCPYCHGYEVRDEPLGLLGGFPEPVAHASLIRQWSPDLVFFPNGVELADEDRKKLAARGIQVAAGVVTRLVVEDDRLTGVELEGGAVVARKAVFVKPKFVPNDDLLRELGCDVNDDGWVVADPMGRTSVSGVYAAGNAVNPFAQVITAAAAGSTAAAAINFDLVEADWAEF